MKTVKLQLNAFFNYLGGCGLIKKDNEHVWSGLSTIGVLLEK